VCNYGGFDNTADIIDGVLQATEYWPCPKRGHCLQEGKLCDALRTDTGHFLTKRELQVLVLVAKGELDKQIADTLGILETTVATHTKNIARPCPVRSAASGAGLTQAASDSKATSMVGMVRRMVSGLLPAGCKDPCV